MRYYVLSLLLMAWVFTSCEITVKKPESAVASKKIRNGIQFKAEGLSVEQAFLIDETGALISEDNKIKVNQKIRMRLIVSGWTEKDGKVFLDASEKAATSDGDVMMDEKDLFKEYKEGIEPKDAGFITLSFQLTHLDKLFDYFKISFRLSDKNDADKYVEGSYKLYM